MTEPAEPPPPPVLPWWALVALYLAAQAGFFLASGTLAAAVPQPELAIVAGEAAWIVLSLGLTAWFWVGLDRRPWKELGLSRPSGRDAALGVALGAVQPVVGYALGAATGHLEPQGPGAATTWGILMAAAAYGTTALAIGIAEELPFRGYLLPAIGRGRGLPAGIAFTSVLFAGLHLVNPDYWSVLNLLQLLLMGIGLAWLRLGTGSLWVPILAHGVYDFGLFASGVSPEFQAVFRTGVGPPDLWFGGVNRAGIWDIVVTGLWLGAIGVLMARRR